MQTMVPVILVNPYRHIPRQTAPSLPAFPKMASRVSETTDDLPTPHQDPYYTLVREDSTPVSRLYLSPTGQEESRDDTANFLLPSGTRCLTLTPRLKFQPPLPREKKKKALPYESEALVSKHCTIEFREPETRPHFSPNESIAIYLIPSPKGSSLTCPNLRPTRPWLQQSRD